MTDVDAPANAVAAATHADPYPYYAALVRDRPVYYDQDLASWIVSSADGVSAVLTSQAFAVRPLDEPIPRALVRTAAGDLFGRFIRMTDYDERGRLKSIIAAHLDSIDSTRVGTVTDTCAATLFERLGHPLQWGLFTPDFALRLAPYVVMQLFGIRESKAQEICEWLDAFVRCLSPTATADDVVKGSLAAEYLSSAMTIDDGLPAEVKRDVDRAGFDDPFVATANMAGLVFQSYEGTAGLIGNTLIELSRGFGAPEGPHRITSSIHDVVEHVVRTDSPVQNTRRYALQQVTMLGETFAKGDRVLLVVAAANRDPSANGRIFTFGAGAHACVGATLAMTMATKAVEYVVGQGVNLAPIAANISYRPSINVRIPIFGQQAPEVRGS